MMSGPGGPGGTLEQTGGGFACGTEAPIGCSGNCGGAELMCFEPAGQVKQVNWKYVGEGKGGYNKVQSYNYVGAGGSYNQQQVSKNYGNTARNVCKGSLVLGVVGMMVYYYFTAPHEHSHSNTASAAATESGTTTQPASSGTPELFNCHNMELMIPAKEQYCCQTHQLFCRPGQVTVKTPQGQFQQAVALRGSATGPFGAQPFECSIGFNSWQIGWSAEKKAWCCTNAGRACPSPARFDCVNNRSDGWTPAKKAWCCEKHHQGCEFGIHG